MPAPTALQELAYAYSKKPAQKRMAERGLRCLREWGIREFDLIAVGHGITEQFSMMLRASGLLPPDEANDGYILAETPLAEIPGAGDIRQTLAQY